MKKLLVVTILAFSCIGTFAHDANAIGVYGIWSMPNETDEDGWGIGLKEKRTLSPLIALDGRVSYIKFSTPDAGIVPIEFTACLKLGMLYGGIGAGYYIFTGDNALEDTVSWYVLAGIELLPGPVSFFGEVKWQMLEPDLDTPGGGSFEFDALVLHAGVTLGILK